jgi:hypothetical protein
MKFFTILSLICEARGISFSKYIEESYILHSLSSNPNVKKGLLLLVSILEFKQVYLFTPTLLLLGFAACSVNTDLMAVLTTFLPSILQLS